MNSTLRIMTYNVHGCVGVDRRLDVERIGRVIASQNVDAVALQELDVSRTRSGGRNQPRVLADQLGMHLEFLAARDCDGGHYGNAVLSRYPLERVRGACLPRVNDRLEPRALQWVRLLAPDRAINLLNTHLGLDHRERMLHTETVLGRDWIADASASGVTVLCGDFNALPRSLVYQRLTRSLRDAQLLVPHRRAALATFPSLLPIMRIDHLLVSSEVSVRACEVVRGWVTRIASDHLPIVAELDLGESAS
jgi:endonuclease/exonuclease/phosphatase family metal-dependent hydrolase